MTEVLPVLLRLSLFGSLLALALFALKPLLRGRVSRTVQYYLWLLVLLRLCIPAGLTLTLPEAPAVPVQPPAPAVSQTVQPDTPAPVPEPLPAAAEQVPVPAPDPDPVNWSAILSGIWAVGAALCAGRYLFGYCLLRGKIRRNETAPAPETLALLAELEPSKWVRVAESAAVDTPLLLGPFAPVIVLPPRLTDPGQLRDILAHELTHARRYDLLYKWFAALTVSVHWFNPLMILIRREISRACELACDEAVIKTLDAPARQHYGETLLSLAAYDLSALALPMCGEKRNLKERLVSIVKRHRRTPATIFLTAALLLTIGGCSLVMDAAREKEIDPGIYHPETGVTIDFGMAREDVEALLGKSNDQGEERPHLDVQGRFESYVIYDNADVSIEYGNDRVKALHAPLDVWTTKEGISAGGSVEEVQEKYHVERVCDNGPDEWCCELPSADCTVQLYGTPTQGLTNISIYDTEPGFKGDSDTFDETTPGLVTTNVDVDYCLTLGMSTEEIGPRAGQAHYRDGAAFLTDQYDGHYYYYFSDLLVFYDEDGKAIQFITEGYGAFYQTGSGGSTSWRTPRGITYGSTLEEIQAQYPNVTTRQADYAWFGMMVPTKITAALVQEEDQELVFWLREGTGVFGMGLSVPGVPLPNTGGAA